MTDGAQNAMLGYLYQFSLIASLRAYSVGDLPAGSGWRTIVGHIAGGQLKSEMFGQDGMVAVPKGKQPEWVALQVKYSDGTSNIIDLQFFVELLYSFDKSRELAAPEQVDPQRYYLLSNLPLNSTVERLWINRSAAELKREIEGRKRNGKWPEWAAKLFRPYTNEVEAISRWSTILARLEPILVAPFEFGFNGLIRFAQRHGVLDSEIQHRLAALAGQLMFDAASGRSVDISERWLKGLLVGAPDARDASFTSTNGMLAEAQNKLTRRLEDLTNHGPNLLTRRRYADELQTKVDQHRVTFICGGGGSGKSVIALQYLLASKGGPVGLSLRATDISQNAIPELLKELRSQVPGNPLPLDTLEQAVQRLRTANPDQNVLLAVNIDALDEAHPTLHREIGRVVRMFVDHGDGSLGGKLLVSCRPRQHKFQGLEYFIQKWIDTENPAKFTDRVGLVELGDFDETELEAVEAILGDPPDERLRRSTWFETFERSETLGGDLESPVVPPDLIRSLLHPVVWGVYAGLTREERGWVRIGRAEGTDRLAQVLIERFLRKCEARHNQTVQQHHLETALRKVAAITVKAPPPFAVQGAWQEGCKCILNPEDTSFLYGEALTYGLIEEDQGPSWRWRHGFVAQYLARGEG